MFPRSLNRRFAGRWGVLVCFLKSCSVQFERPAPKSSIGVKNMTSITHMFQKRNDVFARAVGLLLVLFIFYGTTIEAAHRHSPLISTPDSTYLATSDESSPGTGSKTECDDCLICQLHQNFAASLISIKGGASIKLVRSRSFVAVPKDVLSEISSPRSGRAPPFTL